MLRAQQAADRQLRHFLRTEAAVRHKIMKNWGVIGGIAAALAAGIYVLWGPITDRKKRRKGLVPGLLNLGNTCFMNSLLQGLSACPSFIKWLEEFTAQYKTEQHGDARHQYLSVTLLHILKALSTQETVEDDVMDASCLLEVLRMYRWQISSFEEQDAHELFHVLTSSLEDERERRPRVTHLFDIHSLEEQPERTERQISCRTEGSLHHMPTHWKCQHPFHGRLTSNMLCKRCKHQSPVRYDTFDSLSLSIPAAAWGRPMTLDQCLQHFISSESVKDVVCENCTKIQAVDMLTGKCIKNQKTTFVRQLKLGKITEVGLLPAAAFLNGACSPTMLPSNFTSPFVVVPDYSSSVYLFRLMAVVVHHGDMHSGHFVTYRRSPSSPRSSMSGSSQWLWISDDIVRKASLQEVLSSNAYLLFYERICTKLWQPSPEFKPDM